jgi:N-formylglutamate deformylase
VSRNKPYAGGFITEHYGNPAAGLHAIQLELNRALYMDERRFEKHAGFARLADDLSVLVRQLRRGLESPSAQAITQGPLM